MAQWVKAFDTQVWPPEFNPWSPCKDGKDQLVKYDTAHAPTYNTCMLTHSK